MGDDLFRFSMWSLPLVYCSLSWKLYTYGENRSVGWETEGGKRKEGAGAMADAHGACAAMRGMRPTNKALLY